MSQHIITDFEGMPQRYRAAFFNSLWGFRTPVLIGTKSNAGSENLAIFSNFFHLGAHPPLLGIVFRPDSADRHTLENLKETSVATCSFVKRVNAAYAHQTSARYPREISEFEACGFTPTYHESFGAPYVGESAIAFGIRLLELKHIEANDTQLAICSVEWVKINPEHINFDGTIRHDLAESTVNLGLESYGSASVSQQFAYAKPDKPPTYKASGEVVK